MTLFLGVFIAFHGWLLLSNLTAYNPALASEFYRTYLITFLPVMTYLTFSITSLKVLKRCLWVFSGSVIVISAKVGFVFSLRGGGVITTNITGFVGDNNGLALAICLVIGPFWGLSLSVKNKWCRYALFTAIAFAILTVLYTQSRGGFLSLATMVLGAAVQNKNRIRNLLVIFLIALVGFAVLPKDMFGRLGTLHNVEEDASAMGRVEMWKLALVQAKSSPLVGTGLYCFREYNKDHWPDKSSIVTHSVYFQILAAAGYPALLLYLILILIVYFVLKNTYAYATVAAEKFPDLHWTVATTYWMRFSFIGYLVGSGFLDMLVFDTPWYFMLYASLFQGHLREELEMRMAEENVLKGS
jgi:probable O-glycosylation ligase (exosortase A-associated)